jgi:hypothetical protein
LTLTTVTALRAGSKETFKGGLMSNPIQAARTSTSYAGQNLNAFFPGMVFGAWSPCLVLLRGNADVQKGFSTIAAEWQAFVSRRLQEGVTLTQRLTHCHTREQILTTYTEFWHKTARDYGKEIATMTELMADLTNKIAMSPPFPTLESHPKFYAPERAPA